MAVHVFPIKFRSVDMIKIHHDVGYSSAAGLAALLRLEDERLRSSMRKKVILQT